MSVRPIDADALENMGYELHRTYQKDANMMVYEVKKIADVPTIEAEPVRRGWWERYDIGGVLLNCSECKAFSPHGVRTRYCPWCGAKMEVQEWK